MSEQLFVIDPSDGRHRAPYEAGDGVVLLRLGLDAEDAAVINPWDVDDLRAVPAAKVDFLLRLNALIVGRRGSATRPFGLSALERSLLAIAIRDVYARAADAEGTPSQGLLRSVLGELARQERADPAGSRPAAATYEDLARRLADVCDGGRFAHLLDRPTRLPAGDAPLVILGIAAVGDEMAAVVLLTILECVGRRAERGERDVSLLDDAIEQPSGRAGDGELPAAFAPDTLLHGLHESYLRRRMRGGEVRAIAYLHAISDVALFLHPPTALSRAHGPRPE